jgi:hypothetical protein
VGLAFLCWEVERLLSKSESATAAQSLWNSDTGVILKVFLCRPAHHIILDFLPQF